MHGVWSDPFISLFVTMIAVFMPITLIEVAKKTVREASEENLRKRNFAILVIS